MAERSPLRIQLEDGIALVTLHRPNALNGAPVEALHRALDLWEEDPSERAVVVTGAGADYPKPTVGTLDGLAYGGGPSGHLPGHPDRLRADSLPGGDL